MQIIMWRTPGFSLEGWNDMKRKEVTIEKSHTLLE